jgi:hypothetical protein
MVHLKGARRLAGAGLQALAGALLVLVPFAPALAADGPPPPAPLSDYFSPALDAPAAPDHDGFIRRWMLLDPITKPNPTNIVFTDSYVREALSPESYPGRFGTLPRAGAVARSDEPLEWHALDSRLWDVKLFNFAQSRDMRTYGVVFWAVTVIDSPREIADVRLAVGSNSASRWWLNGELAAELFDDRRMVMDDVLSDRLTLRKGRNVIHGAVINGPGLSDLCVRLLDESGQPIRDVKVVVQ